MPEQILKPPGPQASTEPVATLYLPPPPLDRGEQSSPSDIDMRHAEVGSHATRFLHDIGSGLAAINTYAYLIQMILEQPLQQGDRESSTTCQLAETAGHIMEMVRVLREQRAQVLQYVRGESPITSVEPLKLSELFTQFELINRPHLARHNITLEATPIDLEVLADKVSLVRALQNLTSNAAQAMSKTGGSIILTAERKLDSSPPSVQIHIRDTGPGIPESVQERVFEPFTTSGPHQGTGLGLSIVKSIIEAQRGAITYETSSSGTLFTITLPEAS